MEPAGPNAYRRWAFEQLLVEAKRARAGKASRWNDHPELGPLKDELRELARSPGGIDDLSEERRARFHELMRQIDTYAIHDPWGKEAGAVLVAIYREVVQRGDGSAGRLAADLDIWIGYVNLFSKVADPERMENVKRPSRQRRLIPLWRCLTRRDHVARDDGPSDAVAVLPTPDLQDDQRSDTSYGVLRVASRSGWRHELPCRSV